MRTIKVLIPFVNGGRTYRIGEIVQVPVHALPALGEHAELVDTTFEDRMQAQSSDYAAFCLQHENTYADGHCPTKNSRRDPLTGCAWWQQHIRSSA
jgi:hypothetical protein